MVVVLAEAVLRVRLVMIGVALAALAFGCLGAAKGFVPLVSKRLRLIRCGLRWEDIRIIAISGRTKGYDAVLRDAGV